MTSAIETKKFYVLDDEEPYLESSEIEISDADHDLTLDELYWKHLDDARM